MAKGARGGKRGAGGSSYKGKITLSNGESIEFDGELRYGKDDASLTGFYRTTIESWESKRGKNKIEYAYALDDEGIPMGEIRGGKGSVRVPPWYHDGRDSIFTHNHPREQGYLGGTFSDADLYNFATGRNKTFRARAKEGTYSISRKSNFKQNEFKKYVKEVNDKFDKNYSSKMRKLQAEVRAGNLNRENFHKEAGKAFNTSLIELHNDYQAGQKKYGYDYTLERNKA